MTSEQLADRARMHAALGDELRLAIAEELLRSDRSPAELAEMISVRSNLLAHHLDVLEEAGAIDRVASAGDARRRYVRLSGRAAALLGPPASPPRDVLFVCTRNSARSQLAAALWQARTGRPARSAGTRPAESVSPGAVAAARRAGLGMDGARPRRLGRVGRGVQVISVCDIAHEEIAPPPSWWHWSVPAPSRGNRPGSYDGVMAMVNERMDRLGIASFAASNERGA